MILDNVVLVYWAGHLEIRQLEQFEGELEGEGKCSKQGVLALRSMLSNENGEICVHVVEGFETRTRIDLH